MNQPIFNKEGRVELWLFKSGRLVATSGQSMGFIDEDSIYDYNGFHRGWFFNGIIRDHNGLCVSFARGARDTVMPILPIPNIPPIPPILNIEPIRPIRQIKPIKPIKHIGWSPLGPLALFYI